MDTATALDTNPALVIGLQATVPLLIIELNQLNERTRERRRRQWAANGAREVGSKGDALQYGSKKSGEAAKVFAALARGLAAAAYQPGGVTAFGQHWCADHALCEAADAQVAARPSLLDHNPDEDEPDEPTYMGRPVKTITTLPGDL